MPWTLQSIPTEHVVTVVGSAGLMDDRGIYLLFLPEIDGKTDIPSRIALLANAEAGATPEQIEAGEEPVALMHLDDDHEAALRVFVTRGPSGMAGSLAEAYQILLGGDPEPIDGQEIVIKIDNYDKVAEAIAAEMLYEDETPIAYVLRVPAADALVKLLNEKPLPPVHIRRQGDEPPPPDPPAEALVPDPVKHPAEAADYRARHVERRVDEADYVEFDRNLRKELIRRPASAAEREAYSTPECA